MDKTQLAEIQYSQQSPQQVVVEEEVDIAIKLVNLADPEREVPQTAEELDQETHHLQHHHKEITAALEKAVAHTDAEAAVEQTLLEAEGQAEVREALEDHHLLTDHQLQDLVEAAKEAAELHRMDQEVQEEADLETLRDSQTPEAVEAAGTETAKQENQVDQEL